MTGSGFDVIVTCLPLGKVVPAHPASSPRSELSSFGPQSSWLGPSNQLKVAQNSCWNPLVMKRFCEVWRCCNPPLTKARNFMPLNHMYWINIPLYSVIFFSHLEMSHVTRRDDSEEGQPPPSPLQQLIATPEGFLAKQRRRLAEGSREGCYDFAILCVFWVWRIGFKSRTEW